MHQYSKIVPTLSELSESKIKDLIKTIQRNFCRNFYPALRSYFIYVLRTQCHDWQGKSMNLRNCPLLLRLLIYGPVYTLEFMKFLFKDSFKIDKVKLSYPNNKNKMDPNGVTLNGYLKEVLDYLKDKPTRLKEEKQKMRDIIKDFLPTFPIAFRFVAFGQAKLKKSQVQDLNCIFADMIGSYRFESEIDQADILKNGSFNLERFIKPILEKLFMQKVNSNLNQNQMKGNNMPCSEPEYQPNIYKLGKDELSLNQPTAYAKNKFQVNLLVLQNAKQLINDLIKQDVIDQDHNFSRFKSKKLIKKHLFEKRDRQNQDFDICDSVKKKIKINELIMLEDQYQEQKSLLDQLCSQKICKWDQYCVEHQFGTLYNQLQTNPSPDLREILAMNQNLGQIVNLNAYGKESLIEKKKKNSRLDHLMLEGDDKMWEIRLREDINKKKNDKKSVKKNL